MLIFRKICGNPNLTILRRIELRTGYHFAESDSVQANTARSFAGINFVLAGVLPCQRKLNSVKNIGEIFY